MYYTIILQPTYMKSVYKYLEYHTGYYSNLQDVEFIMLDNRSLCICANWWVDNKNQNNYIELAIECTYFKFVKLFEITSLLQIELLSADALFEKYKSGHTEICCSIDEPGKFYSLSFQLKHNYLWATDNMNDSHKVQMQLETAAEFMEYTKQHLGLPQLNKNNRYRVKH